MHRFIPNTADDRKEMLDYIGANSVNELFNDIPKNLQVYGFLKLDKAKSEMEVFNIIDEHAKKNKAMDELTCFLGAGACDHYIPSIIKHIYSRSEFYTAYTPYQAEISQGTLQMIFEYQTMLTELTSMDVTNASLYDGATACVEAAIMALNAKRKTNKIVVSKTVNPETRLVLKSYMQFRDVEVVEVDMLDGVTDIAKLEAAIDDKTAGVVVQSPNFFGAIEDVLPMSKMVHEKGSLIIDYVDIISLGVLKSPGELDVDIAVGEGQALGIPLNFGGPYIGFITAKKSLVRKMPGRIIGETVDVDNKRAYTMTLQAREQHIRRFKATSNICSNQGLCTLMAATYMVTMGKEGIKEVGEQCMQKSHYAYEELIKDGKFKPVFNQPFFKEFAVTSDSSPKEMNEKLLEDNILGGYELEKDYSELKNAMLLCVTEKRTKAEIDKLVNKMGGM
jgi:glycine dehydrogenase subunit 1